MTEADYHQKLFERFAADHPEHADARRVVELPDGRCESMITLEALEAFARWCQFNGLGDPAKVLAMLTDGIPAIRQKFADLERGPTWGGGGGSALA